MRSYESGYIPKIKYWLEKITTASTASEQIKAVEKVRYFQKRQVEVYGTIPSLLDIYQGVE
jgi:hypothetical protein